MEQVAGPGVYEFGGFRLDARRRTLCALGGGDRIAIAPKVFDAGLFLVEHAGELLPKSRMLAHLWPQAVVEENSLTQAICDLRRALGEQPGENRFVVTVPRRGYQFVADVRRLESPAVRGPSAGWSIAVLPFDNPGRQDVDELLATGLAESILHGLACGGGVRLVAQTSAVACKSRRDDARTIGRRLQSHYLVEGSVQHCGPRLRITVQLIDTADGTHVWSLMFDRGATDLFAVEDEVAAHVVLALRETLRSRTATSVPADAAAADAAQGRDATGFRNPLSSAASSRGSRP